MQKAAIFKNKYNRSFDYGNSYISSLTQKGNDLVSRNQNLISKKPPNTKPSLYQLPKPIKMAGVGLENPYRASTQKLAVNGQEANIFKTGTEATRSDLGKSVVSDTGGQITFNQGTANEKEMGSLAGRSGKRCIFMTGSELGGGDSIVTNNDGQEKDDSV